MRRLLHIALLVLVMQVFGAVGASSASAETVYMDLVKVSWSGWVYVDGSDCSRTQTAFRLSGTTWVREQRSAWSRVYITPYPSAPGWYWTYSADRGWTVMRDYHLIWSREYINPATAPCMLGGGRRISG